MNFVLAKSRRYWWPVKIKMPAPELNRAGKSETFDIKVQFQALGLDEAKALDSEIAALPAEERADREHDHLLSVVINWDGVCDEDDEPVPFGTETLRQALQTTWFRIAIYEAYSQSLTGEAARRKN